MREITLRPSKKQDGSWESIVACVGNKHTQNETLETKPCKRSPEPETLHCRSVHLPRTLNPNPYIAGVCIFLIVVGFLSASAATPSKSQATSNIADPLPLPFEVGSPGRGVISHKGQEAHRSLSK